MGKVLLVALEGRLAVKSLVRGPVVNPFQVRSQPCVELVELERHLAECDLA